MLSARNKLAVQNVEIDSLMAKITVDVTDGKPSPLLSQGIQPSRLISRKTTP
jgi:hypothetical protein